METQTCRLRRALLAVALETSLVEWKLRSHVAGADIAASLGNFLSGMETQGARQGALDGPGPWKLP